METSFLLIFTVTTCCLFLQGNNLYNQRAIKILLNLTYFFPMLLFYSPLKFSRYIKVKHLETMG